ncbi:lipopolysaccharide biosynthesis protein [Desertibacillus haloalkaliphilus]|uniref:lipopolysaccharide biosynthesis protein n=1 Tax=Desertibacillus haloalkaliphilus TaxID=1328930 RepID=UPI001C276874|nr:lipopolysaccharide biosynthesis protein [Desertibacillus haloalkaliphilus]MBU8906547.1 lipopolysaccharide biosynthesis protein [Desertibacillus haloalkaliphilus]
MSRLQAKAINSIKWTTIQTIFLGVSAPLLLMVKARFLTPSEFGVLAIATIFIGLFQTLNNFGISQAVIQRDNLTKQELSSLFFFNIFLASFLSICLFSFSDSIGNIFSLNELSFLLKILSLMFVISGPSLLFRALLEKQLYFKELSIIQIVSELILIVGTILFLINGLGLLGVIIGQVVSTAFKVLIIFIVSKRKDILNISLYFSFNKLKPFIKFGLYVSGKQVISFLTFRVDQLLIGYFLAPEILGIYYFAKNMLERLRSLITSSFAKVLFPLLSKLKNNKEKLTVAYQKISRYVALFSFPVFIGIALTAHLFVPVLFGEEWVESVFFFQVFSIALIPLVLTANLSTSLLYSVGKPNEVFYIDLIINVIYILCLSVFTHLGIYVVLSLYCGYVLVKTTVLQYQTSKYLLNTFIEYLSSFKTILFISFLLVLSVLIIQSLLPEGLEYIIQFIITVFFGISTYILATFLFEKGTLLELKSAFVHKNISIVYKTNRE